jgi:hypothetical protein
MSTRGIANTAARRFKNDNILSQLTQRARNHNSFLNHLPDDIRHEVAYRNA